MWLIPSIPFWSNPLLNRFAYEFGISRESMIRYAENLLEDYQKKNPNRREDVHNLNYLKKIAKLRRINSIDKEDLNVLALLRITKDGFTIVYTNTEKNKGRRNFSIAHEIGHTYFYDINKLPNTIAPNKVMKSNEIEKLCDIFATNLLMPKEKMLNINISKSKFYFETIHKFSEKFGTSVESSFYRIAELELIKHHRDQNFFVVLIKRIENNTYSKILTTPAKFNVKKFSVNDNILYLQKKIKPDEPEEEQALISIKSTNDNKPLFTKKVDCKAYFRKYLTIKYPYLIGIYEFNN